MMYAQSKGIYYVQVSTKTLLCLPAPPQPCLGLGGEPCPVPMPILSLGALLPAALQLEDDIVAKPNYLSTMKNFALQQPSEDWMILEFSQLGFIGGLPPTPPQNLSTQPTSASVIISPAPALFQAPVPCGVMLRAFAWSARCSPTWPVPTHPLHGIFGLTILSALCTCTCLQAATGLAVGPSPVSPTGIRRK